MRHPALATLLLSSALGPSAQAEGVSIDHKQVGCVVVERFSKIEARFDPAADVARARVHFRAAGAPYWYFVEMRPEPGAFYGVLPKPKKETKKIEYYVEVLDRAFAASRTAEYAPDVVAPGTCRKDMLMAAAMTTAKLAVGAATGAPVVPLGFSAAGIVPAAAAGTAAGASAGTGTTAGAGTAGAGAAGAGAAGGISTGLVVGVVGAGAAVAAVAATAGGGESPATTAPATTAPSGTPTTTSPPAPTPTMQPPTPTTTAPDEDGGIVIDVTPRPLVRVPDGGSAQFSAVARDRSGNPISPQPRFSWSSTCACTQVDQNGLATFSTGFGPGTCASIIASDPQGNAGQSYIALLGSTMPCPPSQ